MKTIYFRENINCKRETARGPYRIILDFTAVNILPFLIKDNCNYIWVHNHTTGNDFVWEEFKLPIKDNSVNIKTLAKSLTPDFILPTEGF